jgi:hypothetical protein
MFMLNDTPLALDTAFTHDDIQYPANWLRLATPEERAAIGITEVADAEAYDDRFYWGVGNPKEFSTIVTLLTNRTKATAFSLLSATDYKLVRKVETGEEVDATTTAARAAIRTAYADNLALIAAATTVEQLAAIQFNWPEGTPA